MGKSHKILRTRYFWPLIFKYFHEVVKKFPHCQLFYPKKRTHLSPLHHVIYVGPFSKWGIDFMHCNPTLVEGHGYIIIAVDYFTKWAKEIPTYVEDGKTVVLFLFNHVIARFGVPQAIVINHESHFRNHMMVELSSKLGFGHENSTPYYP